VTRQKLGVLYSVASKTLVWIVMLLCLLAAALMVVLPTASLKVDSVYQKF
jgi:hypothetical protein